MVRQGESNPPLVEPDFETGAFIHSTMHACMRADRQRLGL
jgi:hypothetical protein